MAITDSGRLAFRLDGVGASPRSDGKGAGLSVRGSILDTARLRPPHSVKLCPVRLRQPVTPSLL